MGFLLRPTLLEFLTVLNEALKAITVRFCESGRIDDVEFDALPDAQDGLMTLKAERVAEHPEA
jgi:hypothetical protein